VAEAATVETPTTNPTSRKTVRFRIRRQDGPDARPYWQEFDVPYTPGMNVIAALMEIRRNPVTADGKPVAPVAWESSCLEEVCGICSMRINGRPRQACSAIVDQLRQPVVLEPLRKFPCVRDLVVDRARMFENLKRVKAWIPVDGTHNLGPGPRYDDGLRQWQYELSKCFTCGICLEVCPNYGPQSTFMGAQVMNQVVRFNIHPTGAMYAGERLEAVMGEGGIMQCGNAQNCVQACPKGIPLVESLAKLKRDTLAYGFSRWWK
jgi:succinate dehydrogenase / fumarate reductase iron-sulfur subunit